MRTRVYRSHSELTGLWHQPILLVLQL